MNDIHHEHGFAHIRCSSQHFLASSCAKCYKYTLFEPYSCAFCYIVLLLGGVCHIIHFSLVVVVI